MKQTSRNGTHTRMVSLLCVLWALAAAAPVSGIEDFRTRIAVVPMQNQTQEGRYDSICRTVTDTVALVFRLMGKYLVVESDEDPALLTVDTSSTEALAAFAEGSRYDEVLVGTAAKDEEGLLTFHLSLFNRKEGAFKYDSSATAGSILEVFDAADEITVGLLSQVSDIHIGFGAVEVKTASGTGSYTVFLNNARIRNPKTMLSKVLNGTYALSIHQNRLLGDTEIYRAEIKVFEDQTTTVRFAIPAATPEETAYLQKQKEELQAASAGGVQAFLTRIAGFQQSTQEIDYDPALREEQSRILEESGTRALQMLKAETSDADKLFYAARPDFKTAREKYDTLTRMVSNAFDYQLLESAEPGFSFSAPRMVHVAANGSVLVVDTADTVILSISSDGRTVSATTVLESVPTVASVNAGQAAFDTSGRVYFIHPDLPDIMELDGKLQTIRTIPIPGLATPEDRAGLRIAVSDDGLIYLLGGPRSVVFEPGGERESDIEKAFDAGLANVKTATVDCAFFDANGRLNVLDATSSRVLRFDALGELLSTIQLTGDITADTQAAVDAMGYYYLTCPSTHGIAKYSPRGELIARFGSYGSAMGRFSSPLGIAVTAAGIVYVADTYNHRVQILTPTTAPILVADVARYGITVSQREATAKKAQERMDITRGNIRARDVTAPLAWGTGLAVLGTGLLLTGAWFDAAAATAYAQYLAATDYEEVSAYRDTVTASSVTYAVTTLCGELSFLGAASLVTSALLTSAKNARATSETIAQIQTYEMDAEYELDRSRYRSLAAAESIGLWTGVLPPLLGAATLFTLNEVPVDSGYIGPLVAGACVLIPPNLSNLYAGKNDPGLLVAAIAADLCVAGSAALFLAGAPDWEVADLDSSLAESLPDLYPTLNEAWRNLQQNVSLYPLYAALGIRLAAGIYDMNTGWKEAKNNNLYRAIRKKSPAPEVSLDLLPGEKVRVAVTLRY